MTYKPNFNDKRIQKKMKTALGYLASIYVNGETEKAIAKSVIEKYIGRSDKDFGRYLRRKLLIETKQHSIQNAEAKTYLLNMSGFFYIQEQILGKKTEEKRDINEIALEWANETYKNELETKNFKLEEKSHRLCSPIQNIRSEVRHKLFAINGMPYSYDIKSASATIIYQLHKQVPTVKGPRGGILSGYDGKQRPTVEAYIQNKQNIRAQLAKDANITYDQAKAVINGVINKARLMPHEKCSLFRKELKSNVPATKILMKHPFLLALRKEINEIWNIINDLIPDRYYEVDGKKKRRKIKTRESYDFYFQEERKIIDSVKWLCDTNNINFFPEHDGWTISSYLTPDEIERTIKEKTGYEVILDFVCYGEF